MLMGLRLLNRRTSVLKLVTGGWRRRFFAPYPQCGVAPEDIDSIAACEVRPIHPGQLRAESTVFIEVDHQGRLAPDSTRPVREVAASATP